MSDSFTSSSGGSTSVSPSAPPATTSESWTSLGLVSTSQSGLEITSNIWPNYLSKIK